MAEQVFCSGDRDRDKYIVLTSKGSDEIVAEVNRLIGQKWRVVGGAHRDALTEGNFLWVQSMVRD